jgi:hypothetical protein
MIKTFQEYKEYGIQFTDDELAELGMEKNQKFNVEIDDDVIKLVPFVKIEVDLDEVPRDILERLIKESAEKDVSVNEIVSDVLENYIQDDSYER